MAEEEEKAFDVTLYQPGASLQGSPGELYPDDSPLYDLEVDYSMKFDNSQLYNTPEPPRKKRKDGEPKEELTDELQEAKDARQHYNALLQFIAFGKSASGEVVAPRCCDPSLLNSHPTNERGTRAVVAYMQLQFDGVSYHELRASLNRK